MGERLASIGGLTNRWVEPQLAEFQCSHHHAKYEEFVSLVLIKCQSFCQCYNAYEQKQPNSGVMQHKLLETLALTREDLPVSVAITYPVRKRFDPKFNLVLFDCVKMVGGAKFVEECLHQTISSPRLSYTASYLSHMICNNYHAKCAWPVYATECKMTRNHAETE